MPVKLLALCAFLGTAMIALFATLSGSDWVMIIGAMFLGAGQIVTLVLGYMRMKDIEKATQEAARESKEVKIVVEEVKKQTDGLASILVAKTEAEGLARGALEEREKADAKIEERREIKRDELKQEVAEVPEKTAVKVVEKLDAKEKK